MITKEEFAKFIDNYKIFDAGIERLEEAITGSKYSYSLFETDWGDAVGKMLDAFLDSHFTEKGVDWIAYWLWENIDDKVVTFTDEDMFGKREMRYHINTLDELWAFLLTDKELYFKNV